MRQFIETQYSAEVLQWDEPDGDGGVTFSAYARGALIVAPSLALLLSALQDEAHTPLLLAA